MGKGSVIKVTYAKVPYFCSHCQKLGHDIDHCLAIEKPDSANVDVFERLNSDVSILGKPPPPSSFGNKTPSKAYRNVSNQRQNHQYGLGNGVRDERSNRGYRGGRGFGGNNGGGGGRGGFRPYLPIQHQQIPPQTTTSISSELPSNNIHTPPEHVDEPSLVEPASINVREILGKDIHSPNSFAALAYEDGRESVISEDGVEEMMPGIEQGIIDQHQTDDLDVPQSLNALSLCDVPEFEPLRLVNNRRSSHDGSTSVSFSPDLPSSPLPDGVLEANESIRMISRDFNREVNFDSVDNSLDLVVSVPNTTDLAASGSKSPHFYEAAHISKPRTTRNSKKTTTLPVRTGGKSKKGKNPTPSVSQ